MPRRIAAATLATRSAGVRTDRAATPGHGDRHDAQRPEDLQDDAHQETDGGNMSCYMCYRW